MRKPVVAALAAVFALTAGIAVAQQKPDNLSTLKQMQGREHRPQHPDGAADGRQRRTRSRRT